MQRDAYKKKRFKGKNFTESEKEYLVQIVLKHKCVVENKKTDSLSVIRKSEVWRKIAEQFNAIQTTGI